MHGEIMAVSSSYTNILSAAGMAFTADTAFFVNLMLAFCAMVALTTLIVLFKKTRCARRVGIADIVVLAASIVMFAVQLVLYAFGVNTAGYVVYVCFGLLYAAFVLNGVYYAMLMRNSHKALCVTAGVLCLFPPMGTLFGIILSYKIKRDNTVKKLVFGGYAYTYAALCAFAEENKAELIDTSDDEELEKLDKKQIKRKLKALKKKATDAEGMFDYAAAIVAYTPFKYEKALKLMRKAAEKKHAPALFNLGYYYETGTFVKRDEKKARAFYEQASSCGDADAEFRLIMLDVKSGKAENAVAALTSRADGGDLYAKYNLGVCRELGLGCERDIFKALDVYAECADADFNPAERRLFAIAVREMNAPSTEALFDGIASRSYKIAEFSLMMQGLTDIKNRLAADASDKFLLAVKLRGSWEGVARCLVGTLYVDRGKLKEDRANGAEYVKSALGLWSGAAAVYEIIPKPKAPRASGATEQKTEIKDTAEGKAEESKNDNNDNADGDKTENKKE